MATKASEIKGEQTKLRLAFNDSTFRPLSIRCIHVNLCAQPTRSIFRRGLYVSQGGLWELVVLDATNKH